MNTTELLAVFREEVFDQADPPLWSDALVYRYIDDAQKQFCRQTRGIEDSRSYKLNIAIASEWYAINPKILKIRDATDQATGLIVSLIAAEKMATYGMRFDGVTGPVAALITGLQKGFVRAHPVPDVASTVELRTFRLPEDIVAGDDFEIDDQHVLPLLFWVKHKAYDVQDAETYDAKASAKYLTAWDAYCARVMAEEDRKRPISTVTYGGI